MTARLMKMSAVADMSSVERTRKPARPAAKPAAPRKRAPAKPRVAIDPITMVEEAAPVEVALPRAARGYRRRRLVFASVVVVAASAAAGFILLRGDDSSQAGASVGISSAELTAFASAHDGSVYWAGPIASRKLELTTTSAGTFVRYLPLRAAVGNSERAITVATYPLPNAYATASARSKNPQMASRETAGGGVAVWSRTRPTSVYLAFPGVPQLIEVYAPNAAEARTLALSGRIRTVR
jgi:hypothetical protein